MKTYYEYSLALAAFKAGIASEAETIMALQIGSESQLEFLRSIQDMPALLKMPLWTFDKVPKEPPTGQDPLAKPAKVVATEDKPGDCASEDDPTQRVWGLVSYTERHTKRTRTENGGRKSATIQTKRFMICQRGPNEANAGQWGLPGGRIHIGEAPLEGMEREFFEEVGAALDFVYFGLIKHKDQTHRFFTHSTTQVGAEALKQTLAEVQSVEVVDMAWWTLEEIKERVRLDSSLPKTDRLCHKSLRRFVEAIDDSED